MYYSNGNIKYEGDWINHKREGNGKYIYKNGNYYIGGFKDGQRHGKGIIYDKNGNIKYDGEFINNTFVGERIIEYNESYEGYGCIIN